MKILIVASWFPSPAVPINGTFIADQARALSTKYDVTVLVPEVGPATSGQRRAVEGSNPYRIVRVNIPARRLLHHLDYAKAVMGEIKTGAFDLIHAHVALPNGYASALAGIFTRRPVVLTEHRGPFSTCMETRRDRLKVRFAFRKADAAIAVSSALRKHIQSYGIRRRIVVVPETFDTKKFPLTPRKRGRGDDYQVLFVGRLNDRVKNLPSLLRALALLEKVQGRSVKLRVVGDGQHRAEYEELARELGVHQLCGFVGALDSGGVAQEMMNCDVFVLPSWYETFGTVVAEAMSVGRPVVATKCGGPEDVITPETGLLVPVNDPAALAGAIRQVCSNIDSYAPEAISAYAVSRFGEEALVSQLTEVYESVLRN